AGRLKSAAPASGGPIHLTGSVFSAVSSAARDKSVHNAVQRLEQANNGGVRLTLTAVPFDELLTSLEKLATQKGIVAESANIQGAQSPGTVYVSLTLNTRSRSSAPSSPCSCCWSATAAFWWPIRPLAGRWRR